MPEPLQGSTEKIAQQAADFGWDGNLLENGMALALSGGGFRAMLFHAGALLRLNELGILSRIARISSVSGGSIAAGYLAYVWADLGQANAVGCFEQFKSKYVEKILQFSRQKLDVEDILTGLLPGTSAAQQIAESYDKFLFKNASLQVVPDTPRFVFCATNLQTGVLWRFSKPYAGDYLTGRIDQPDLPLSLAVTASSAFPPFLSPVSLTLPANSFTDWPDHSSRTSNGFDATPFRSRVLLADGGVYDNHGLEPIAKRYMTLLVSDGGAPFARKPEVAVDPLRQLQRVLEIIDNQVRALRRRDLVARFEAAAKLPPDVIDEYARFGTYWGIDTDPFAVAPVDALPCARQVVDLLARLETRLSDLGELQSKQLVNWGYAICDRCVRVHYSKPEYQKAPPQWPYPESALA